MHLQRIPPRSLSPPPPPPRASCSLASPSSSSPCHRRWSIDSSEKQMHLIRPPLSSSLFSMHCLLFDVIRRAFLLARLSAEGVIIFRGREQSFLDWSHDHVTSLIVDTFMLCRVTVHCRAVQSVNHRTFIDRGCDGEGESIDWVLCISAIAERERGENQRQKTLLMDERRDDANDLLSYRSQGIRFELPG